MIGKGGVACPNDRHLEPPGGEAILPGRKESAGLDCHARLRRSRNDDGGRRRSNPGL